jgi:hypothetical protein
MSSNLQPPASSNSTSPLLPPDSNSSAVGGPQQKKAIVVDGKVVIVDTSSSASGDQKGIPSNTHADASHPQLPLDSNKMTSAQMYSLAIAFSQRAFKQRIRSAAADAMQYQLTWGLRVGIKDTSVDGPKTSSPVSSKEASTKKQSSDTTVSADVNGTGVSQQTTQSTSQSSQNTHTINSDLTVQTLQTEIAGLITLETTLANALELIAKKQKTIANPLAPPEEQAAFAAAAKQFIDAYIRNFIAAGNVASLGPSELYLKIPEINALDLDATAVGAATAVSFSEYVMGLVQSGDIDKFANTYIFPNDPASAKAFAANVGSILLDISLEQVGTALNMQGLADQVEAQAKLVRDQNDILANPTAVQQMLQAIARDNAQTSGLSEQEIQTKAAKAIQSTVSQGPYNTTQDLLTALTTSLTGSFAANKALAEKLAEQIVESSLEQAMGKQKYPFPPLPINPGNINFIMLQSSILNTLQRDFIKSDRDIRQAKKDDDAVKSIVADVVQKQYKNELAVRDDIRTQLMDKIPDITEDQAADIAAHADLVIKHTGPLYNRGNDNILPPGIYAQNVQIGYQANVHAAPQLDFGKAIDHVAGLTTGFDGTNMIALINQNFHNSNTENRSYLNLPASEQVKVQQQRIFDPGAQLVLAWGSVINGLTGPKPDHPQAISIPI